MEGLGIVIFLGQLPRRASTLVISQWLVHGSKDFSSLRVRDFFPVAIALPIDDT
jgi:hypothetical protein